MDANKKKKNLFKTILDSATFALLLSLLLFMFEMLNGAKESKTIVDNLTFIQNSLSTRYLGIFPEYVDNINGLLTSAIDKQDDSAEKDSIIIFEDVLYYGIKSESEGFRQMIENLLTLKASGCQITLAYYDEKGYPFKQMIRDKLISFDYQQQLRQDRQDYVKRLHQFRLKADSLSKHTNTFHGSEYENLAMHYFSDYYTLLDTPLTPAEFASKIDATPPFVFIDSLLSQKHYNLTRSANMKGFKRGIKALLSPLPIEKESTDEISIVVNGLCQRLDSIKHLYLDKTPIESISYADYFNLYRDFSVEISKLLSAYSIELIPLQESMMMCCWMSITNNTKQAIFAFPSKYSTDEIGFVSHDIAIANYIHTMLNGIKQSHSLQ